MCELPWQPWPPTHSEGRADPTLMIKASVPEPLIFSSILFSPCVDPAYSYLGSVGLWSDTRGLNRFPERVATSVATSPTFSVSHSFTHYRETLGPPKGQILHRPERAPHFQGAKCLVRLFLSARVCYARPVIDLDCGHSGAWTCLSRVCMHICPIHPLGYIDMAYSSRFYLLQCRYNVTRNTPTYRSRRNFAPDCARSPNHRLRGACFGSVHMDRSTSWWTSSNLAYGRKGCYR